MDEITFPDDLTVIPESDMDDLEAKATEAFDKIADSPEGEDDLATMKALADGIDSIRGERGRRATAAEQVVAQAEELLKRVHAEDEAPTEDAPEAEADEDTAPEAEATEAEAPVAEATEDTAEEAEPELVTAAAPPRRIPLPAKARQSPVVDEAPAETVVFAKADLPGFSAGGPIPNRIDLARAMTSKARTLSDHSSRVPVASFALNLPAWIDSDSDPEEPERVFAEVSDQAVLTAGGEWCSPSEPVYDYFGIEGTDGLLDLPTVGVRRGGLSIPTPLLLPEDLTTVTFAYTEANRTASDTKDCVDMPCPTWNDNRLEADGFCVTAGNLTQQTNPELIARYIQMVAAGHLHKMTGKRITAMAAASTDAGSQPDVGSATSDLLAGVGLVASRYRSLYRTSINQTLEVVLPFWSKEAVRSDLAARKGVDLLDVSDGDINGYFTARGLRAQFVMEYQRLANATAWPTAVEYLVYAAGAWVAGSGGSLDLGVVRDSTLNATNDHTAAWTEEFTLLANRGPSFKGSAAINVDGITAPEPIV